MCFQEQQKELKSQRTTVNNLEALKTAAEMKNVETEKVYSPYIITSVVATACRVPWMGCTQPMWAREYAQRGPRILLQFLRVALARGRGSSGSAQSLEARRPEGR